MIKQANKVLPVVRGVIIRNGKFLLIQRSKDDSWSPGMWEFPGGKIDFGQDINDALKREVKEETGLDISVKEPLFFWDQDIEVEKYKDKVLVNLYFVCEAPLNGKVTLSEEHDDSMWLDFHALKQLKNSLASHTLEVIERLEASGY